MRTIKVIGYAEPDRAIRGAASLSARVDDDDPIRIEVTEVVRVGANRGSAADQYSSFQAEDDSILEFELNKGLVIWLTPNDVEGELSGGIVRGDEDIRIPVSWWRATEAHRGTGDWAIKFVRFLKVSFSGVLAEHAGQSTAAALGEYLDKSRVPREGLFRLVGEGDQAFLAPVDQPLDSTKPMLLFLHGTASNTEGSFGDLWSRSNEAWPAIRKQYGERIYAYQHYTLSKDPLQNAVTLLESLPEKAVLDIISHSRGGLVGELLCRTKVLRTVTAEQDPFDAKDGEFFAEEKYLQQAAMLGQLGALLTAKQISVRKFVRVGCPAGGTTLLSARLDRFLNMFSMAIKLAGGPKAVLVSALLGKFVVGAIKSRAEVRFFPGLEAMIPDSALMKLLNRPGCSVEGNLYIIAGDIQPGWLLSYLGISLTDWFYGQAHDLVVNTTSMRGGADRSSPGPAREFNAVGAEISHFKYFSNDQTVAAIRTAILDKGGPLPGYAISGEMEYIPDRSGVPLSDTRRPVVYVLPGIMGSELGVGDDLIWVKKWELMKGGMGKLHFDAANIKPLGLIASAYGRLLTHLNESHNVIPFAYDWRLSIAAAAERLKLSIEAKLQETTRPIRFIAHSMGGLVILCLISKYPQFWKALVSREGCRVIFLGTPTRGSHSIARVLLGHDKSIKSLALADMSRDVAQLLQIVSKFPGILELLPYSNSDSATDLLASTTWKRIRMLIKQGWTEPNENDVASARQFHEALSKVVLDKRHFFYVAGHAETTPDSLRFVPGKNGDEVMFGTTGKGDGRVPWQSGIPNGDIRTWYLPARHGDLADYRPSFKALTEVLVEGTTSGMSEQPPSALVPRNGEMLIGDELAECVPDEAAIAKTLMGGGSVDSSMESSANTAPIEVKVIHGHVAFARSPVMVGHYLEDRIIDAERAIDMLLHNRLTRRRALGVYAGEIGSAEVFSGTDKGRFPGAVVVGLGVPGELTRGALRIAAKAGAIRFAIDRRNMDFARSDGRVEQQLRMSSILIGAKDGGISMGDTIEAILEGIADANATLAKQNAHMRVTHLDFIEIYQDRAILAAKEVRRMCMQDASFAAAVINDGYLIQGEGGRVRACFDSSSTDWRHLHITASNNSRRFNYLAITDSARVNVLSVDGQMDIVDAFVRKAISQPDNTDAAKTLFELMMPNELKGQTDNQRNLALIVDPNTARFPWELMRDRMSRNARPLAVASGMIRQLRRTHSREPSPMATGDMALVVGDVDLGKGMAPLVGAQEEAQDVGRLLQQNEFNATTLIRGTAEDVVNKLLGGDYRILHLAGHGEHRKDSEGNQIGGMILSTPLTSEEGGRGPSHRLYVNAGLIRQMRRTPEVAFINCCYIGEGLPLDQNANELAATLAVELIDMGASAVIAAGWAINDKAAQLFALEFYKRMLDGSNFGNAVTGARRVVFDFTNQGLENNTWGAYQCYGDFDYRLRPLAENPVNRRDKKGDFISPSEAMIEIGNVRANNRVRTHIAVLSDNNPILHEIEASETIARNELRARVPSSWLGHDYHVLREEFVATVSRCDELALTLNDIRTLQATSADSLNEGSFETSLELAKKQLQSLRVEKGIKREDLKSIEVAMACLEDLLHGTAGSTEKGTTSPAEPTEKQTPTATATQANAVPASEVPSAKTVSKRPTEGQTKTTVAGKAPPQVRSAAKKASVRPRKPRASKSSR